MSSHPPLTFPRDIHSLPADHRVSPVDHGRPVRRDDAAAAAHLCAQQGSCRRATQPKHPNHASRPRAERAAPPARRRTSSRTSSTSSAHPSRPRSSRTTRSIMLRPITCRTPTRARTRASARPTPSHASHPRVLADSRPLRPPRSKIRDTINNLVIKSPQTWHTAVGLPFLSITGTVRSLPQTPEIHARRLTQGPSPVAGRRMGRGPLRRPPDAARALRGREPHADEPQASPSRSCCPARIGHDDRGELMPSTRRR